MKGHFGESHEATSIGYSKSQLRRRRNGVSDSELQVSVDRIEPCHQQQWLALWNQYLDFYGTQIAEEVTARTWRRMIERKNMIALAALRADELVGFAIAILHDATWSIGQTAYLEDLFVRPDERGRGTGRKLISELIGRACLQGCASIYWHTQATNAPARRLYDSFVMADDFVRYRLSLKEQR